MKLLSVSLILTLIDSAAFAGAQEEAVKFRKLDASSKKDQPKKRLIVGYKNKKGKQAALDVASVVNKDIDTNK